MKIIYCANARIPTEKAHGFQISKMCEELSLAGAEVELWVPTRKNHISDDVFSYYNLAKNFSINYIKCPDFISFSKFLGPGAMHLQRFLFLFVLFFKSIPPKTIWFSRDPEIIWLGTIKGLTTVYENHDGLGKKGNLVYKLIRKTDKLITTNKYIKEQFVAKGLNENKILVAPHGIDFTKFDLDINKTQAVTKLALSEEQNKKLFTHKVLLYTGNFTTMGVDKGLDDILKALQILNNSELLFVAVGGNDQDVNKYNQLAVALNLGEQVILYGRQPQIKLGFWQKVADILLMPFPDKAHYRYHMAPLKMFEYLVSQRPILASELPSIRQVLNENTTFFCHPGDPKDLAEKIKYILEHTKEADQKAKAAYRASQKYSWSKRSREIVNFLK